MKKVIKIARCTSHIDGVIRDQTTASGACIFDRSTGFPTSTCDFLPLEENDAKASLMFAPALSYVSQLYHYIIKAFLYSFIIQYYSLRRKNTIV